MMAPVQRIDDANADPVNGSVVYDKPKALWNLSMVLMALVFAPATASVASVLTFAILTYFSLLIGHSVGMHRMMIHRTFNCPGHVEQLLIYTGVLVGMSGPHGIL